MTFLSSINSIFSKKVVDEQLPEKNAEKLKEVMLKKSAHKVDGKALIIKGKEKLWLRLENFKTFGGPDLRVHLSQDMKLKESIELGKLKANRGNFNYEIPNETNLSQYKFVLIKCKTFNILFSYGKLND